MNTVTRVLSLSAETFVSADADGRILVWDSNSGLASRPPSLFKHKIKVSNITANSSFVYSSSDDLTMMQYKIETGESTILTPVKADFVKKHSSVLKMQATDAHLFVLHTNHSFHVLDAEDIEKVVVSKDDLGIGNISTFALDKTRNEIWFADDKGFLHVFDSATLEKISIEGELKTHYGHPAQSMAVSSAGLLAVGDTKGYVTVLSCADRTIKSYYAHHSKKVLEIAFTDSGSHIASLGFENAIFITNSEDHNDKQKIERPSGHTECRCFGLVSSEHVQVLAGGYDCGVRLYA